MKAIAYCRVSTENQKEEGTIDLQREAIKEYCRREGIELLGFFEDEGVSGGLENRPGLAELFNYLENGGEAEAVIIYKLDRLARDLYIQEHLIKKLESLKVKLISTKEPDLDSSDPMRKAFRQFMGIVAELEKAFITMRLTGGRKNKLKLKKAYAGGGIAYGYRSENKELIIDQERAEIIRLIFKLRKGRRSYREIARILNEQGITTARGGKWHAGTIRYIVKNPVYKGRLRYSEIEVLRPDLALM